MTQPSVPRRGVLAAGGAVLGAAAVSLPEVLAPPGQPVAPVLRMATVLAAPPPTAVEVTVQIDEGGPAVPMPFLHPYVPVAGDKVQVALWGGDALTGIVLGGRGGQAGNLVLNSDFARHAQPQVAVSKPPYTWAQHTASGEAAFVSGAFSSEYQRHEMLIAINTGIAGDNYAYSAAIPVTPGETLYADAVADPLLFAPSPTTLTTRLVVGFFAAAESVWPNFLSQTIAATVVSSTAGGDPFWLTGSVVVPADATFARVAIRATQTGGDLDYTLRVNHVELTRNT